MVLTINGELAYEYINNPYYFITKTGKIYSVYKIGGQGAVDYNNPHLLSYGTDKDGYYRVVLSINGIKRYVKVHTIIVEQFIGEIIPPNVVNHKDGNKQNNNVDNLEITTVKENTIHAHKNNLTSIEIPVNVEFENKLYEFNSLTDCMNYFPDISKHYLEQLRNEVILFSMILFEKVDKSKKISPINAYYNGTLYKTFRNMKEADIYFGKSKGAVYASMISNEYRTKVNKYKITFPNVSTIENTD